MTDEMIKAAVIEANQVILEQLPSPKQCQHEFSKGFQKKMKRLIFKRKHPVLSAAMRTAAGIATAILVGGGLLLTFNAEVRAEFLSWIKESSEGLVMYLPAEGNEESDRKVRYRLPEIPEGYEVYEIESTEDGETFVYENEQGQFLMFFYFYNFSETALGLYTEGYECINVSVGELKGEMYLTDDKNKGNAIVWKNENVIFSLDAFLDAEELLKMAESIEAYE